MASVDIAANVVLLPRAARDEFPGTTDYDRWVSLGRETFGVSSRLERHLTGLTGRNVHAVGFEAVGADARCVRATAHYDNGDIRELNIENQYVMREGMLYRIELPGERNLRALDLECHAVGDNTVTINLFGNKDILAPIG